MARIKGDRQFGRALYAEARSALLGGETAEGLPCCATWFHAQ